MSTHFPIGLLGGTFDPPHEGHLSLALSLLKTIPLQEIRFIPCAHPLLRKPPIANPHDRIAMLKVMIKPYPHFKVDDLEIKRGGSSYTINTLKHIRKSLGAARSLCFIMSMDQFVQFDRWYQWEHILEFSHLIVVNRPHHELILTDILKDLLAKHQIYDKNLLHHTPFGFIIFESVPPIPISSTEIRASLSKKREQPLFCSTEVWKYICEHHLYGI